MCCPRTIPRPLRTPRSSDRRRPHREAAWEAVARVTAMRPGKAARLSGAPGREVDARDEPHVHAAGRRGDDLADLTEVGGAEEAGGDDGEEPGVLIAAVDETVDGAAGDEDHLAGADLVVGALDGEGDGAGEAVDRLPEGVVAVRCRQLDGGGHVALEGGQGASVSLTGCTRSASPTCTPRTSPSCSTPVPRACARRTLPPSAR